MPDIKFFHFNYESYSARGGLIPLIPSPKEKGRHLSTMPDIKQAHDLNRGLNN